MSEVSIAYAKSQRGAANEQRGRDHYATPDCAVTSLIANVSDLPARIWEPCAGEGALADVLISRGFDVFQSDAYHYDENPNLIVKNFFDYSEPPKTGFDCIITNPPYMSRMPARIASHALAIVPRIFLLLRIQMLEGHSPLRNSILDGGHLKNVYIFRDRLPRMHRRGWEGNKAGATGAFAWFEWDTTYKGLPQIVRINTTD